MSSFFSFMCMGILFARSMHHVHVWCPGMPEDSAPPQDWSYRQLSAATWPLGMLVFSFCFSSLHVSGHVDSIDVPEEL